MTPVVLQLLIANIALYVAQQMIGGGVILTFALWPLGDYGVEGMDGTVGFQPWQLVTYAFLHGGTAHLLLNMFAIYMFGRDVEMQLGTKRFALLYFASVLTAALVQLWVSTSATARGVLAPTVGASGGVFGILLAFGVMFPRRQVMLLIPPIPMPAWVLVTLYGALELANGVFRSNSGVAHFAHLGGMIGAGIVLLVLYRSNRPKPRFPQ